MRGLGHRRPGDVVVRRARRRPETVRVATLRRRGFRPRPWMVPLAFATVIAVGGGLLSLPVASESGGWTNGWDELFTSTSAVCVTGLARFDTAENFDFFGEVVMVLAALMFLGRLGPLIVAVSIPDRPQERYRYAYGRVRIG